MVVWAVMVGAREGESCLCHENIYPLPWTDWGDEWRRHMLYLLAK